VHRCMVCPVAAGNDGSSTHAILHAANRRPWPAAPAPRRASSPSTTAVWRAGERIVIVDATTQEEVRGIGARKAGRIRELVGTAPTTEVSSSIDISRQPYTKSNDSKDLRRILRLHGCIETRQRGSHFLIECGSCVTTVPVLAGEDIGPGLLRRIERDLEPCLGKGWLKKS
jgi:predicted RNA binding protein YcfA (HicA-like mRNA interferase family)